MHLMKEYTRLLGWIKLFAVLIVPFLSVCCHIDTPRREHAELKDFLKKDDAGLVIDGRYQFKYSQEDCQISINKRRRHIRLQQDNQSKYMHIQLSAFPTTTHEKIEINAIYKTEEEEIKEIYTMDAAKIGTGKIWLWDNKKHTGMIIPVCW